MRSLFPALFALAALGCSAALPSADDPTDAGSSGADAGVTPCAQTDPLTQRCLDVETQQVACASGAFSVDHAWLDDAATVRYVANGASGEGRTSSSCAQPLASSPQAAPCTPCTRPPPGRTVPRWVRPPGPNLSVAPCAVPPA